MLFLAAVSLLPRPRFGRVQCDGVAARRTCMMAAGAAGMAAGGGGDLFGGGDDKRNAQLASLRKMFGATSDADASTEVDDARKLGLFLDLPLCRFSWCILCLLYTSPSPRDS